MGEVVAGQRRGLTVVGHEPRLERFGVVVGAHRAAGSKRFARAVLDAVSQNLVVDLEFDDGVELFADLDFRRLSSAAACGRVRGKPSRMNPLAQSGFRDTIRDDADHDLVWHQPAGRHDFLGLEPDRRTGLDGRTQHVAGRELGNAELLAEDLGLRPFARARGAQVE